MNECNNVFIFLFVLFCMARLYTDQTEFVCFMGKMAECQRRGGHTSGEFISYLSNDSDGIIMVKRRCAVCGTEYPDTATRKEEMDYHLAILEKSLKNS